MLTIWRVIAAILLQSLLSTAALPQGAVDVSGATDFEAVDRFPGSRIVDFHASGAINYRLALGRLQRVNGRVTAGREERIPGNLTRITYQMPTGYSGADVFEHFASQIRLAGTELFSCQGRACGSSNFWANDILGNRILYGPEQDQFYLAATIGAADTDISGYLALYVITRGNRSVYAHLDVLQLPQPESRNDVSELPVTTAEDMLLKLQEESSAIVQGLRFDDQDQLTDDSGLGIVLEALLRDPQLRVYIVAHLRGDGELDALLRRSERRAATVRQLLVDGGVGADRLTARGVGPLAPACRLAPCAERIELVLQQP